MFLIMAVAASKRSTCARRDVGCVLVNASHDVIAIGYNGGPRKSAHCKDEPCPGAGHASGTGLELCAAIHAEQNALLRCHGSEVHTAYVTASPCMHCVKMLVNTMCRRIVFLEEYSQLGARTYWHEHRPMSYDNEENAFMPIYSWSQYSGVLPQ